MLKWLLFGQFNYICHKTVFTIYSNGTFTIIIQVRIKIIVPILHVSFVLIVGTRQSIVINDIDVKLQFIILI